MSVRLPERVGRAMAKQLMFTSRRIDATTAAAIGLVDVVAPDDELDATVDRLAAEILANSPGTNRRVKRLIADREERTRTEALLHERTLPYGLPEDMQERMSRG
jgi:enoyl-CoA hydratase/carnithine racemase